MKFSTKSIVDDFGRVLFLDGGVYRTIQNDKKEYCIELLESKLFYELSEKGLIPKTIISNLKIDGFDLILEHEALTEILQHEWSFDMLKDAAAMVLNVNEICTKYGYQLKDAHTLNVLFRGTQPVWVDLGSISKTPDAEFNNWRAYNEFLGSFVIPLLFWSNGMIYIVRKLLESNFYRMFTIPSQSIVQSGLLKLLPEAKNEFRFKFRNRLLFKSEKEITFLSRLTHRTRSTVKFLTGRKTVLFVYENDKKDFRYLSDYFPYSSIKDQIDRLKTPQLISQWQGYHDKFYSSSTQPEYSSRFKRIIELIKVKEGEISSVLDLAGNEGYVCRLINEHTTVKRIIMADYDANAVNSAYLSFSKVSAVRVHTVLLNFIFTRDLENTFSRFKSDLVLVLAVTHHLILTQKYSIQTIFERIKEFSNKYVMIEFMPLGLWSSENNIASTPPAWYNEEWFHNEFKKYFTVISREQLEKNRILFWGSVKNDK